MKRHALARFAWWILPCSILWSVLFLYETAQTVTEETAGDSNIELHLESFARARDRNATVPLHQHKQNLYSTNISHHDEAVHPCYPFNSLAWLQGPRLGNIDDPSSDMDVWCSSQTFKTAKSNTLLQAMLDQSICSEGSRFRTMHADNDATVNNDTLKSWTTRLIYWSMHYHQTRHAQAEAKHRRQAHGADCSTAATATTIGPYDFECPNATFIVASLANVGLGANIRGGMVYGYLAGLVSNRVVVWVNDSPVGHKFLRRPWALVSCDGDNGARSRRRRDAQCLFRPTTPCVLTYEDVEQAYALSGGETQRLLKHGQLPKDHEHDKVWYVKLGFTPLTATPVLAAERLQLYARYLIREHLVPTQPHLSRNMLYQAVEAIITSDDPREGYNYGAANVKIHHALVVYAMRLRSDKLNEIKDLVKDLVTRNVIDPELSMGLPIRGRSCMSSAGKVPVTRARSLTHTLTHTHDCLFQPRISATRKANVSPLRSTCKPRNGCGMGWRPSVQRRA